MSLEKKRTNLDVPNTHLRMEFLAFAMLKSADYMQPSYPIQTHSLLR